MASIRECDRCKDTARLNEIRGWREVRVRDRDDNEDFYELCELCVHQLTSFLKDNNVKAIKNIQQVPELDQKRLLTINE